MPSLLSRALPASLEYNIQRTVFVCLAAAVSLVQVSIAASQILLAAAIAVCLWDRLRRPGTESRIGPIIWPVLALFLWTMLAALLSSDVLLNLSKLKKFFLFLIIFLVPVVANKPGTRAWIYRAIFGVALMSALAGLVQYALNPDRDALHRISGFMGHWMAYSGTLMLSLVALAAYALCYGLRKCWWAVPIGMAAAGSMYLSQTRSALLGATAGIIVVLLLLRRYRTIAGLMALLVAAYFLSPTVIRERLRAGFDPNDPNTRNRIELFGTALRLIRDNPWLGVGPQSVEREAQRYRSDYSYPDWMYQHMHNNFLQMAAERGIPGLILWFWLMVALARNAWDRFRSSRQDVRSHETPPDAVELLMVSAAALGAWGALLVAGMFEYNFGDSEVLTLFLFQMSAPNTGPTVEPTSAKGAAP